MSRGARSAKPLDNPDRFVPTRVLFDSNQAHPAANYQRRRHPSLSRSRSTRFRKPKRREQSHLQSRSEDGGMVKGGGLRKSALRVQAPRRATPESFEPGSDH